MLSNILKKFDLSEKQINVYLAALSLGQCYARDLARWTNINRSTVYLIADGLAKNGLLSCFERANVRVFSPVPPESLVNIFKNRISRQKKAFTELRKSLPRLKKIAQSHLNYPKVRYYEGLAGIKEIYQQVIKLAQHTLCGVCVQQNGRFLLLRLM